MKIKAKSECRWDLVSLGEVMLRLDPGDGRIHTARTFQVWEGGGEYNVARGLRRCFGMDTAIVTALAENPVGRLAQDLIYQAGVDQSIQRRSQLRLRLAHHRRQQCMGKFPADCRAGGPSRHPTEPIGACPCTGGTSRDAVSWSDRWRC